MIRKGEVRVNKKRIKPVYKLACGDIVRIPPVVRASQKQHKISARLLDLVHASILFENSHLLVVNKPAGLAVHGGSGVHYGLIEVLRQLYPQQGFLELVHRLDRETSGCILIAKKRSALTHLHQQLRERQSDKRYLALACGYWQGAQRQVDLPLLKNTLKSGERIVTVDARGKSSQSVFIPKQRYRNHTLLEIKILSGRTHQIRVHSQYIQHPLAGDEKYGSYACNQRLKMMGLRRLFLHASLITIDMSFSDAGKKTFKAPLPEHLLNILEQLDAEKI